MPPANEKLIQHRCKNHVIIICHRSIFTCRNSSKKNIEDKIKINACNHPTPKVHIYLQKQLKIDENIKINPCNHPTPKVHIYLQKQVHNSPLQKLDRINETGRQYRSITIGGKEPERCKKGREAKNFGIFEKVLRICRRKVQKKGENIGSVCYWILEKGKCRLESNPV